MHPSDKRTAVSEVVPLQSSSDGNGSTPRKRPGYQFRQHVSNAILEAKLAVRARDDNRMQPSIFVIGVQKAGTTSLFGHLARHPQIMAPLVKEVHYFDVGIARGHQWYGAHFPKVADAKQREDRSGYAVHTFDTTPYYMFHPLVAQRLLDYAPRAKIIAVLRDPVARAWSHYWHEWSRGFERLTPEAAFDAERLRLPDPHNHIGTTRADHHAHQHFSYCARSEYDLQLLRWRKHVAPENLLCLRSEQLFNDSATSLDRVSSFLGIAPFDTTSDRMLNAGHYEVPPVDVSLWLKDRLAASMAATQAMLGDDFAWA